MANPESDDPTPLGPTQRLTLVAMFVAISVVVARLPTLQGPLGGWLRFDGFPVILAGLMLGPSSGFMVGGLSDLLQYFVHATGAYNPIFTLTRALTGAIPSSVLGRRRPHALWLVVAILVGQLLTKACIIPLVRMKLYGFPLAASVPKALAEEMFHSVLYAWLTLPLLRAWRRYRDNPDAF